MSTRWNVVGYGKHMCEPYGLEESCPTCENRGLVELKETPAKTFEPWIPCPKCNLSEWKTFGDAPCPSCRGWGERSWKQGEDSNHQEFWTWDSTGPDTSTGQGHWVCPHCGGEKTLAAAIARKLGVCESQ
jgi:DnaJ-class molecular chaperone